MNLLQDVIHLQQFGLDEGAVGAADVTDVVQAQVVQDQNVPVVPLQGAIQVPGHIVVDLNTGETPCAQKHAFEVGVIRESLPLEQTHTDLRAAKPGAEIEPHDKLINVS